MLGPILFLLYTAYIIGLVEKHQLTPHLYADDAQVYGSCKPAETGLLQERLTSCADDIGTWMAANRLQLNAAKTELLWCGSQRRVSQLPAHAVQICGSSVQPMSVVHDLGVLVENALTLSTHITRTV